MAGATTRVEFEPDWLDQLRAAEAALFESTLGPAILADMQAATPIDTSRLVTSEDFQVVWLLDGPELQVGVYEDDEGVVEYWHAVEFGFHGMEWVGTYVNRNFMGTGREVVIRAHERHGNSPEQPYLRPALYRVRTP